MASSLAFSFSALATCKHLVSQGSIIDSHYASCVSYVSWQFGTQHHNIHPHLGGALVAQAAAPPVPLDLLATLVVVSLHGLDQLAQGVAVVRLDLGYKD